MRHPDQLHLWRPADRAHPGHRLLGPDHLCPRDDRYDPTTSATSASSAVAPSQLNAPVITSVSAGANNNKGALAVTFTGSSNAPGGQTYTATFCTSRDDGQGASRPRTTPRARTSPGCRGSRRTTQRSPPTPRRASSPRSPRQRPDDHPLMRQEDRPCAPGSRLASSRGARRGEADRGSVLILAFIYLGAVSITVAALAGWASNDLRNTTCSRRLGRSRTPHRSTAEVAITSIRYTPLLSASQTLSASPPRYCWGNGPIWADQRQRLQRSTRGAAPCGTRRAPRRGWSRSRPASPTVARAAPPAPRTRSCRWSSPSTTTPPAAASHLRARACCGRGAARARPSTAGSGSSQAPNPDHRRSARGNRRTLVARNLPDRSEAETTHPTCIPTSNTCRATRPCGPTIRWAESERHDAVRTGGWQRLVEAMSI